MTTVEVIKQINDRGVVAEYIDKIYHKHFPNFPLGKGVIKSTYDGETLYCLMKLVDDTEYVITVLEDIPALLPGNYPYVNWEWNS
jgi:hypothetical protein